MMNPPWKRFLESGELVSDGDRRQNDFGKTLFPFELQKYFILIAEI